MPSDISKKLSEEHTPTNIILETQSIIKKKKQEKKIDHCNISALSQNHHQITFNFGLKFNITVH